MSLCLCGECLLVLALLFVGGVKPAVADEPVREALAIRVATLHVGDGRTIANALIVSQGGKFVLVGEGEPAPGTKVRTFERAHAAPGFVDGFTRAGVQGGAAEDVEVLTPQVRAADAFDARSPQLRGLVEGGTTLVGLTPAPSNVVCGRAAAARLGADGAKVVESAGPLTFSFMWPALRPDRVPATLAGARRLLECAFRGERWRSAGDPDPPVRDQAIADVAATPPGLVIAWADSLASATTAVDTLRAKQLDPVLVGVRGCAEDADALAALGVPCVVTGLRAEDPLAVLSLPARLAAKGVPVAISTSAPDRSPRSLRLALSLAVAAGLPGEKALAAATSVPAKSLGLGLRAGLVAPNLDADLVVTDGVPWEIRSRVLLVLSAGEIAYERATETSR